MKSRLDDRSFARADEIIESANAQIEFTNPGKVSASLLYAAARYNSDVAALDFGSAQEMAAARARTVEVFMREYKSMLEDNLDDYIAHFDERFPPDGGYSAFLPRVDDPQPDAAERRHVARGDDQAIGLGDCRDLAVRYGDGDAASLRSLRDRGVNPRRDLVESENATVEAGSKFDLQASFEVRATLSERQFPQPGKKFGEAGRSQ